MNAVFYLLVLIPCLVAGFNRVPTYQVVLDAQTANIPASGLAVGTAVIVTALDEPFGNRAWEGQIAAVDKTTASVKSDAPDGAVTAEDGDPAGAFAPGASHSQVDVGDHGPGAGGGTGPGYMQIDVADH